MKKKWNKNKKFSEKQKEKEGQGCEPSVDNLWNLKEVQRFCKKRDLLGDSFEQIFVIQE
jgi:hypothetical protein